MGDPVARLVDRHLHAIVDGHPDGYVGRRGNRAAVDYADGIMEQHGWRVTSTGFETLEGEAEPVRSLPSEGGASD